MTVFLLSGIAVAQDADTTPRVFEAQARAVDSTGLMAGKTFIKLWGVDPIEGMSARFMVESRTALDDAIGFAKVRCQLKKRVEDFIYAQCTNNADVDLGLFILQQGYGVVSRSDVYGTVFEGPYIQAESEAKRQQVGVWSKEVGSGSAKDEDGSFVLLLSAFLLLCILAAFAALTLAIMRGFKKVTDAQQQNTEMIVRERALRNKEREIFATMLDSEIKNNKSKIDAYLVVYEEMLHDLRDLDRTPKYKKAGDIVQAQPALDRSVFDRNTDKLDILGDRLSSEVIHFYARIKNKPDFINLEPEMSLEDVIATVDKAYKTAILLNQISDKLIDLFEEGGYALEEFE